MDSFFFLAQKLTKFGPQGTGACLLYGISRVVIGENKNYVGGEAYLRSRGVEVVVLDDKDCTALMDKFIEEKPELWYVVESFFLFLFSPGHQNPLQQGLTATNAEY